MFKSHQRSCSASESMREKGRASQPGSISKSRTRALLPRPLDRRQALLQAALLAVFVVTNLSAAKSDTYTVRNTNNSGQDSLREAIELSNSNPPFYGDNTIMFDIPGSGVPTIALSSPLPAISQPVFINGLSQPGGSGVELNGASAGAADGLHVACNGCRIWALVINRFSGNGIRLAGNGNSINGCYVGTDPMGTVALGNSYSGVRIEGADNRVGALTPPGPYGTGPGGNVIAGNGGDGVLITGGASNNLVISNTIGGNRGMDLHNGGNGVLIDNASGNTIGAPQYPTDGYPNTIWYNVGAGVRVSSGTGNLIMINSICQNGGLGIDLTQSGNHLQAAPVIQSASFDYSTGYWDVYVTLNSNPNRTYLLDIDHSDPNPPNNWEIDEGQSPLVDDLTPSDLTVVTNSNGFGERHVFLSETRMQAGRYLTMTATDVTVIGGSPVNDTSQFSAPFYVPPVGGP